MKKILALILLAALTASAQIQLVVTNGARMFSTTNTLYLSSPGVFTNLPVTAVNPTVISQGDSLPVAFTKINNALVYLQTNSGSGSGATFQTTGPKVLLWTNPVALVSSNFWGKFTNVYSFESSITLGTNSITNLISLDGIHFTNYYRTNPFTFATVTNSYTNYIGTNFSVVTSYATNIVYQPVWLSSLSSVSTGSVMVAGVDTISGYINNIVITNTTTLPAGSAGTAVSYGILGGVAYIGFGIPKGADGAPGTNTVTAYALSNFVASSQRITTYQTNFAFWGASNFLARVAGLYDFRYGGGNDGGNPPANVASHLVGSYNGSNSWFTITNGFRTTNTISIAHIRDGAAPVNPGSASLYSVDHFELLGRTNSFFGQNVRFDYPAHPDDAATKGYADALFNSGFNGNWVNSTDTNGVYHTKYQRFNFDVVDMSTATGWIPIATNSFDGVNMLMVIQQTNLVSGWFIESMTNLIYQSQWATWTNYTLSTNSGAVTFTIPINLTEEARFFRARGSATNSVTFNAPVLFKGGSIWPSNTFSLADITNRMAAYGPGKHYATVNSNGLALVTLSYSNGVVRWIRADY